MMRQFSKKVKMPTHELRSVIPIQYLFSIWQCIRNQHNIMQLISQFHNRQIYCTTSRVPRFDSHIPLRYYLRLINKRIKFLLSLIILWQKTPSIEMVHSFLRPKGIINYQSISELFDLILDIRESRTCTFSNDCCISFVSIYDFAYKITFSKISSRDHYTRIDIRYVIKLGKQRQGPLKHQDDDYKSRFDWHQIIMPLRQSFDNLYPLS